MAARKRASLSVVLSDDDTTTPAAADDVDQAETTAGDASETTAPAAPARKTTRSPRKKGAAAPAKKTSTRQPAAKKTTPAKPAPEPIRVKAADAKTAAKVSLYLHPEDKRELGMAKLDDDIDANSRIRAMIALWREDPRVRAKVDKLAKTAPRGGML